MVSVLAREDLGKATATTPVNGHTYDSEAYGIGQLPVTVTYPGGTTSQFSTFCVDVFSQLNYGVDNFSASGQPLGTALVPPTNAGAIAYLYNQYNSFLYQQFGNPISNTASAPTNPLTNEQSFEAQALQLAIWKLLYDTGSKPANLLERQHPGPCLRPLLR